MPEKVCKAIYFSVQIVGDKAQNPQNMINVNIYGGFRKFWSGERLNDERYIMVTTRG